MRKDTLPHETPIYPPPHALLLVLFLLAFASFARAQQGTLQGTSSASIDGGTLSYQTYFYSAACGPGAYFNQTTYTNFQFVIGGVTYPLGGQQVVAQGFGSVSCPNYTEPSSFTVTLPNTNNSSVPAGQCTYTFSNGIGSNSCPDLVTNTIDPLYKVVSILYEPPGNESAQGLTSSTTDGTSTSTGDSFTFSDSLTFSSGVTGVFSDGITFGFADSTLNSSTYVQTWTNSAGLITDDNYLDPAGVNGATGTSGSDDIQHGLDVISIWLNPEVTVTTTSDYSSPIDYAMGYQSIPNVQSPAPDILMVPAVQMMPTPGSVTATTPYGTSTVPNSKIIPSTRCCDNSGHSYKIPGLGVLCKNLIVSEYNSQCGQTDQCGCTPADFAQIVVQDPLLRYNATTLTANPVPSSDSPAIVDGSTVETCESSSVPTGSDCRFVKVLDPSGSGSQYNMQLDGQVKRTSGTTVADSHILSSGSSQSYSVGLTTSVGGIGAAMKNQKTWTWLDSQSTGMTNGSSNSTSVFLQTSSPNCYANVLVYEDTLYHTFAFSISGGLPGCN